jgi:large subunit ribosomal protein L25
MSISINAVKRDVKGTGASRRARRAGNVPGVVYGGGQAAVNLELNHKELFLQFRHEAFHASILDLILDGKKESVLLRDYQMHPVRNTIQHIDFQRVSANEKIHVKVPFHFLNEDSAPGVKLGGGIVAHIMTEAEVSCLPKDLPEFIEVNVGALELGDSVHLSQVNLPKGVEFVALAHGNDAAVAAIAKTRGGVSDDEAADAAVAADAAAQSATESAADKAAE